MAGSCGAALPADVEMRLRFPHERDAAAAVPCQVLLAQYDHITTDLNKLST